MVIMRDDPSSVDNISICMMLKTINGKGLESQNHKWKYSPVASFTRD